jgi:hypothetical protein
VRLFPPRPRGLKGRTAELSTLTRTVESAAPARIALVGGGGSGKSMLAAALAHRLSPKFGGRLDWFRVGAWDFRTLVEMLALRWGTTRERRAVVPALREVLDREERLVVLDNHEDDSATAALLDALSGTRATFVITARRCLLSGVLLFPVTAPLVTSQAAAFPRVAALTRRLRWNPLALDVADAIVASRDATVPALDRYLAEHGIDEVRVIDHEDDLPEVALLVGWAWSRLRAPSRRMLGVLAHLEGDHADLASVGALAGVPPAGREAAMRALARYHLVQETWPGRFTLHAVVRYAVTKRTRGDADAAFEHYVSLLEAAPERLVTEQTHLFAAMDHAHRSSNLAGLLRVERLLAQVAP